jgi:hypothetical protein
MEHGIEPHGDQSGKNGFSEPVSGTQVAENDPSSIHGFRRFFTSSRILLNCSTQDSSKELRVTVCYQVK